ncbi:MAG: T9SS type A sorting domain-containing protein [bacterium]
MKTKSLLILLIMVLSIFTAFSQPYTSIFTKDTTKWSVVELIPDAPRNIVYFTCSDTIINSKVYHKIYRQYSYQSIGEAKALGYVHEDTARGKYWFLENMNDTSQKELFMDLSLNKGDTMEIAKNDDKESAIVDSVYFTNNRKFITLNTESTTPITYIEGIGPSYGFYYAEKYPNYYYRYRLLCKFDNDTVVYSTNHDLGEECFYEGTSINNNNKAGNIIDIYPNPSNHKINIEINDFKYYNELRFIIYTSTGNKINSGPLNKKVSSIRITNSGFYLVKIYSDENNINFTKKIIINTNQ